MFPSGHSQADSQPAAPAGHQSQHSRRSFDHKTWILAPSPVFSRGIQHLVERSEQIAGGGQSRSSLAFCFGWSFQPGNPSPGACPELEEGSADLHHHLGSARSWWGRVRHLGGVMAYSAVWLWHIKPTGTQVLQNNICARRDSTGAGGTGGHQLLVPHPSCPPMSPAMGQGARG